jgi:hypothetical protein
VELKQPGAYWRRMDLAKGFDALRKVGRLDLSVEAQVLRTHFVDLFTDVERAIARARLAQYGYVTKS